MLKIDELLVSADPLARLHLTQERIDLHAELVRVTNGQDTDLSSIEKDFVRIAKQYGELAGVTFAAWRQVGVDTEVLDQAGIVRTGPARPDASRVRRPAADGPNLDGEPLLARTEPIDATEPTESEPSPAAQTAGEPELPLEQPVAVEEAPTAEPDPAPEQAATPPAPPAAQAPSTPARKKASPASGTEAPKLRRKRIAD
ncbi:MAG: hypothetical protein QOJ09_1333 [Actinomycetota bacterium]|nr:hypothetical protein [Actinomycetota bacterium]